MFYKANKSNQITYPSVRQFNALPNPEHEDVERSLNDFWRIYLKED